MGVIMELYNLQSTWKRLGDGTGNSGSGPKVSWIFSKLHAPSVPPYTWTFRVLMTFLAFTPPRASCRLWLPRHALSAVRRSGTWCSGAATQLVWPAGRSWRHAPYAGRPSGYASAPTERQQQQQQRGEGGEKLAACPICRASIGIRIRTY